MKGRIAKMNILVWLDAFWTAKPGLKHSCEKATMSVFACPL